jgi:hypothetical protein
VDFKLENVLVSLHSLKIWASAPLFLRNGELLGHSPIHTSLSPIRRGFAPGFVNYKKGALDSQPQVIKFTSCLHMVGGSLRVLRLPRGASPRSIGDRLVCIGECPSNSPFLKK